MADTTAPRPSDAPIASPMIAALDHVRTNETVSALYIFSKDGVVHGAPGQFNTQSVCGIATGDMTDLYTPAQAAYFGATPAKAAEDIEGATCPTCFA